MSDHDFDAAAARPSGFVLRGERFPIQNVNFKTFADYIDADTPEGMGAKNEQTIAFVTAFIPKDERARFSALLDREDDPVSYGDLQGLAAWLIGVSTDRPTVQPASSSRGQVTLPAGSVGAPSSRATTRTG